MRGELKERHNQTRSSGTWKAGGALRGKEVVVARQEATQQPASKQEANGSGVATATVHHQNTRQQSNGMEVPADMRCWWVQGG